MKTVPVDLKKISDAVDNEVAKSTKFNALKTKVNNLQKKVPDATTLTHINQNNTDKQNLEKKWKCWKRNTRYDCLVTVTVLNTKISELENKIPNTSSLVNNCS